METIQQGIHLLISGVEILWLSIFLFPACMYSIFSRDMYTKNNSTKKNN